MSSIKFDTAKEWFEKLRDQLVNSLENLDTDKFIITEWNHKSELGQARIKAKRLKDLIKTPLEPSINKDGKSS